jgi:hypothetical protein
LNGVPTICTNSSTCVGATGTTPGTCTAYAGEGQACAGTGPFCLIPDRCVGRICALIDPSKCH